MSMVEHFFSVNHADHGDLFKELSIWRNEKYRNLQGIYPVISLSFANVKDKTFQATRKKSASFQASFMQNILFCWTAKFCMKQMSVTLNVCQKIWMTVMHHLHSISYLIFCIVTMEKSYYSVG